MNQFFKKKRLSKEDDEVEAQFKRREEEAAKKAILKVPIPKERQVQKKSQKFKRVPGARTIFLARQGIHYTARHFMEDMTVFMPNVQQLQKFTGEELYSLNTLADQHKCDTIMLLESKSEEVTLFYIAAKDEGPTVCFRLTNAYGLHELPWYGTCERNTPPILVFDKAFDSTPEYAICKTLISRALSVPPTTKGVREKVDTVLSFFILQGHIWFRRYQVVWDEEKERIEEAGPKFCLQPIYISSGSFCGAKLWNNPDAAAQAAAMKQMIQRKKKTRVIENINELGKKL